MTRDDLFSLIQRFSQGPLPALDKRHVYVWHGEPEVLHDAIPAAVLVEINLHQLAATIDRAPRAQDEAMRLLRAALERLLKSNRRADRQQVFFISGCDLLSRYRVPAKSLYALASEQHMIILAVSPAETRFQPSSHLPDYVSLNTSATLDYLRSLIGEAATVTAA